MRDLERWKDKVEFSLDGRQLFYLFFGGAVVASLIFVLGVFIGKRLEARALAMSPPVSDDPLAALDQLNESDEGDNLTFHRALTREVVPPPHAAEAPSKAVAAPVETPPKPAVSPAAHLPVAPTAPHTVPPAAQTATAPRALGGSLLASAATPPHSLTANSESPSNAPARALAATPVATNPVATAGTLVHSKTAATNPGPPLPHLPAEVATANGANKHADPLNTHYTLQLSAFPEKGQAEQFVKRIQGAGYKPFIVMTEIPGRGIFYRVRIGDFTNHKAAVDAKSAFEHKQHLIAYVAKL